MSVATRTYCRLQCDGCGAESAEGETAMETRAKAYTEGWRFPPRRRRDGSQASRASDVCPSCLPDWEARPSTDTWKNRRAALRRNRDVLDVIAAEESA